MKENIAVDIRQILEGLNEHQIQVTGPTSKNGESVYRVNEHTLTERDMRRLAHEDRLTT